MKRALIAAGLGGLATAAIIAPWAGSTAGYEFFAGLGVIVTAGLAFEIARRSTQR